jgi:hypothetical protein
MFGWHPRSSHDWRRELIGARNEVSSRGVSISSIAAVSLPSQTVV